MACNLKPISLPLQRQLRDSYHQAQLHHHPTKDFSGPTAERQIQPPSHSVCYNPQRHLPVSWADIHPMQGGTRQTTESAKPPTQRQQPYRVQPTAPPTWPLLQGRRQSRGKKQQKKSSPVHQKLGTPPTPLHRPGGVQPCWQHTSRIAHPHLEWCFSLTSLLLKRSHAPNYCQRPGARPKPTTRRTPAVRGPTNATRSHNPKIPLTTGKLECPPH